MARDLARLWGRAPGPLRWLFRWVVPDPRMWKGLAVGALVGFFLISVPIAMLNRLITGDQRTGFVLTMVMGYAVTLSARAGALLQARRKTPRVDGEGSGPA